MTASLLLAGALGASGQQPAGRDAARELTANVPDGFTLTTVGDCIVARPISQNRDAGFAGVARLLKDADATFGNFEGSLLDIRNFRGHPQAEFGGVWIIGVPEVAKDLRAIGFDLMSRANNHATDWGLEGMRATSAALDAAGIVHAGVGEHRAAARAGRYADVEKGRIGLVAMASSFTPLSRAVPPVGEAPGRPGLNALRTTRTVLVTPDELKTLRALRDAQPAGSVRPDPNEPADEATVFGIKYRASDHHGFAYEADPIDQREILKSIRQAKQMTDFVIATIHAHEPGNWSEQPADFLPGLAHAAIDAGADAFVGHGPHQLRGIEIYKGRPIYYSLGNFIFQLDLLEPVATDLYEQFKMDPIASTDAEFNAMWNGRVFGGEVWYQGVVPVAKYERGLVSEIRLYPIDLNYAARGADRGVPRLASAPVAKVILDRLQRLSQPFGTTIAIEGPVGVIRPRREPATEARR